MRNKSLILLSFFIFNISLINCSKTNTNNKINYEASKKLIHNIISIPNVEIINPQGFSINDTNLVVLDPKLSSEKVKVFDSQNFDLITAFGDEGNGPGEFSSNLPQPISIYPNNGIQVFDWSKKRVNIFAFDESEKNTKISLINDYVLPPNLMLAQKSAFINDSTVISSGGMGGGFLAFTNTESDEVKFFNSVIDNIDDYRLNELMILFDCNVAVNIEKKLIAVVPKYFPELFIINFDGDIVKTHQINEYSVNNISNQSQSNRFIYFNGASSSSEFIYTSFIGKSFSDVDKVLEVNEVDELNISKLYKFTWEGEFVDSYQLNGGFYNSLSIDEKNNRIYSQNDASPEKEIVYFNID